MTGEELYEIYETQYAGINIIVDTWEELSPEDREMWNQTADAAHPSGLYNDLARALDTLEIAFVALGRLGGNAVKFRERAAWERCRSILQAAGRLAR